VQGQLDVREGDGHDRDVKQQHERAQAHRDQRPPLARALISNIAARHGLLGRLSDTGWCGRHDNLPGLGRFQLWLEASLLYGVGTPTLALPAYSGEGVGATNPGGRKRQGG
jgi:hypothetical protein